MSQGRGMIAFRFASAFALAFMLASLAGPTFAQVPEQQLKTSHNLRFLQLPADVSDSAWLENLRNRRLDISLREKGMIRPEDLDRLKQNHDELLELLQKHGLKPELLDAIKKNPALLDEAIDRIKKGEGQDRGPESPPAREIGGGTKGPDRPPTEQSQETPQRQPLIPPSQRSTPESNTQTPQTVDTEPAVRSRVSGASGTPGEARPTDVEVDERLQSWAERLKSINPQLSNSPAMHRALETLAKSIGPEDPKWRKLAAAGDSLRGRFSEWSKSAGLERFWPSGQFQLPEPPANIPDFAARAPDLSGSIGLPNLRSPELSSGNLLGVLAWIVGLVAAAICLRQFWLRAETLRREALQREARRKAWPVDPDAVKNREDLIRAYEHLALANLGLDAKSWNHLAIAASLGKTGDSRKRNAALALTDAYEHARYAPLEDNLSNETIAEARRHLSLLAGVHGA